MKSIGALAAVLLAATTCAQSAHARPLPHGSYMQSCTHIRMHGDRLSAECRRRHGGWQRTVLDVSRCVGDVGNLNGRLSCNRGPRGQYGSRSGGEWRDGYGSSRPYDWRDNHRTR